MTNTRNRRSAPRHKTRRRQRGGAKYRLLSWIDENNLSLEYLLENENPQVLSIIKKRKDELGDLTNNYMRFFSEKEWAFDFLLRNQKFINWAGLNENTNPRAIDFLINKNKSKIDFNTLSSNESPKAIEYLRTKKPNEINFCYMCDNKSPEAMEILKQIIEIYPDDKRICWDSLSSNPYAIKILKQYQDKIHWDELSRNPSPEAIEFLKDNQDKIVIDGICANKNPKAMQIIIENLSDPIFFNKLNWEELSLNPAAIKLLKDHPDLIDWVSLSENPAAIELLEQNQDKIDWEMLSKNPGIFEYDYAKMENTTRGIKQEMIAYKYHPAKEQELIDKLEEKEQDIGDFDDKELDEMRSEVKPSDVKKLRPHYRGSLSAASASVTAEKKKLSKSQRRRLNQKTLRQNSSS